MISNKVRGTNFTFVAVTISVFLMLLGFASVGFAIPVANNDGPYAIAEDTVGGLVVAAPGVLANDVGLPGMTAIVDISPGVLQGTLALAANGGFTFTPVTNFNGPVQFTYYAKDSTGNSVVPGTVTINVTPVNDLPVAVNDPAVSKAPFYSTLEDVPLTVVVANGVLFNDTDVDGPLPLTVTNLGVSAPPTGGTVTAFPGDGSFVFTPAADFNGTATFRYFAVDATPATGTVEGIVSITVVPVNDPPVAVNDPALVKAPFYVTNEDTPLTVLAVNGVLFNDTDIDGAPPTIATIAAQPAAGQGTVALASNGSFVYTPGANFSGVTTFTYNANDGALNSVVVGTVTITVNAVNDPPVAVNDTYTVNEDATLLVPAVGPPVINGLLFNDTDAEIVPPATPPNAVLVGSPSNGTLTVWGGNGSFTYVPNPNFNGTDTFTYRANDGALNSTNFATVTITVNPIADAPVANADTYTVNEDTTLNVPVTGSPYNGVLFNDSDVDTPGVPPPIAQLVTPPTQGALTLSANGSFIYTPNPNWFGVDQFTYRANDGALNSGNAIATINVASVNDPPVAVLDSYTTPEDTALNVGGVGVLGNDTDIDGVPIRAILVTGPTAAQGVLVLSTNGAFVFTPAANFNGTATFTYKANDGAVSPGGDSLLPATVTITVTPVNDPPVANNDAYTTVENSVLIVPVVGSPYNGVLFNDTDVDTPGPPAVPPPTALLVTGPTPAQGVLAFGVNGSFQFTPALNFNGTATFTYRAVDGLALPSTTPATVTITVTNVPNAPVGNPDAYFTLEDTTLTVPVVGAPFNGVLYNDTDADTPGIPPPIAVLLDNPTNGTLTLSATGAFIYVPNPNFNGTDTFTYRASDGGLTSGITTATITVGAVPDAPVANADTYRVDEDTPLIVPVVGSPYNGVLFNDINVDTPGVPPAAALLLSGPFHGTFIVPWAGNGSFSYLPNVNWSGIDTFTYRATNGLDSNIATVTIMIGNPPVAVNDPGYTINEDTLLTVPVVGSPYNGVLFNDTDIDTPGVPPPIAELVTGPTNGTLTLAGNGSFTYMPNSNWSGTDSFTYRAFDNIMYSILPATATITVVPVNDAPVAVNDTYTTTEDVVFGLIVPVATGVLFNDTDIDTPGVPPPIATLVTNPANGTVVLSANGAFTYMPNPNWNGTDSFTYNARDIGTPPLDSAVVATVSIVVTPVNDAPVAVNDAYTTLEDVLLTVPVTGTPYNGVLFNDTDIDTPGVPPTIATLVTGPTNGTLTLAGNGSFTYAPNANWNGTDSFTYNANDGTVNSAVPATVTITVTSANDAPVAVNDAYTALEGTALIVPATGAPYNGVLFNDTDLDTPGVSPPIATLVTNPAHGTVVLNSDGSFTYTPAATYYSTDSFTYNARDVGTPPLDSAVVATVSITITEKFVVTSPIGTVQASVPVPFSVNISIPGITGATLYYKQGGATTSYLPVILSQSGIAWSGIIPASDVTVRGLLYYVGVTGSTATHPAGGASAPANISVHAPSAFTYNTTPSPPNVWNMISPNGTPDDTNLRSVVGPTFNEGSGGNWIAYSWDPSLGVSGNWVRIPNALGTFVPGTALFFAKSGSGISFVPFPSTSVDVRLTAPFEISLHKGWNLVANPYGFPVAWDDTSIIIKDSAGLTYSPTAARSAGVVNNKSIWMNPVTHAYYTKRSSDAIPFTMMPNQGQWLECWADSATMIIRPIYQEPTPIGTETPPGAAPNKDMTSWEVTLSLQSSAGSDSVTASVGKSTGNVERETKLPGMPLAPYIAFTREDQGTASMLSSDVRSINDELTWSVKATASSEVSLNWSLVNVPEDYVLSLDDQAGKVVNLSQDSVIHLGVGVHDFILKAEKKALIPKTTKLLTNYPNPFNPETWIPYELSKDTDVAIKIYSSSGQLVRSLELGHKMAGFYSSKDKAAHWDGKNEVGEQVSSGIYFYNIQAGDYKDIRKMVIMK